MKSDEKLENLKKSISRMERAIVAFSGGVDSTFLLKICVDVLGRENVIAVTAVSPTYQEEEIEEARAFAKSMGIEHLIIHTHEMENDKFVSNPRERCYFCKKELFSELKRIASQHGVRYVLDATNKDDESDFRPGMRALREEGVISPLREAGITKEEIRYFSKKLGLPTYDKPSQACLASRFPYGEKITEEKLKMVKEAERFLKMLGFKVVRVRHHGRVARIEVGREEMKKILENDIRTKIYERAVAVFATPQTIRNDLIAKRLSLKDFIILIVDEAHRSVKRYSYTFVAKKYMEQSKNPLIFALTASPGGQQYRINEVKNKLFIKNVEIRTREDSDVKPYIKEVDIEHVEVELSPALKNLKNYLS